MSDPFVRKFNWLRFLLLGSAVGTTIFVATIIVGAVVINFVNYQQMGGLPNGDTQLAQVSIGNLWNGIQLSAGESQMVKTTAVGPEAFHSMELWVDGHLAGVQAAPSGGARPFTTFFSWLPNEPGNHALVAAAIDSVGNRTMSTQVVVIISPDPSAGAISPSGPDIAPVVLPAPSGSVYTLPRPPGPNDSVGSAQEWSGSPGDWINSITADEKPTAPALLANSMGCGAELLIHDLSSNEEGFLILKEDSFSPDWIQVAALSANSQTEWISFSDGGLPGTVTYYVASFNSQGEANSNLASLNIDPADCPPESGKTPGYSLEVNKLFPELPSEISYCYTSTDGINWTRWPQIGFLTPGEDGIITGGPVLHVQSQGIGGDDITPRLGLNMECWGWQNEALVQLGDFFVENMEPEFFGSQLVPGEGISAQVQFKPVDYVGQPSYPETTSYFVPGQADQPEVIGDGEIVPEQDDQAEVTGGSDFVSEQDGQPEVTGDGQIVPGQTNQPEVTGGSDYVSEGDQDLLETTISTEIPGIGLSQTYDPEECQQFLPPHAQNPDGQSYYCFIYPQFDPYYVTGALQPYLVWYVVYDYDCLDGYMDCLKYDEFLNLAEESGGVVGFDVTSISDAGLNTWSVTEPHLRMFVMPPLYCSETADFTVRMWYKPGPKSSSLTGDANISFEGQDGAQPGGSDITIASGQYPVVEEIYYGMPSNVVTLSCNPGYATATAVEPTQYLDITFQTIDLYGIDDNDEYPTGREDDVELYGYFRVVAPSMGYEQEISPCLHDFWFCDDYETQTIQKWTRRHLNIADWEDHDGEIYCDGCLQNTSSGHFGLHGWSFCQSTSKNQCSFEGQPSPYLKNNNTIRVFVKEGDALSLEVKLIDHDEASANDSVCTDIKLTSTKSLAEWATMQNEPFELRSSNTDDSGWCIVKGVINAVNP